MLQEYNKLKSNPIYLNLVKKIKKKKTISQNKYSFRRERARTLGYKQDRHIFYTISLRAGRFKGRKINNGRSTRNQNLTKFLNISKKQMAKNRFERIMKLKVFALYWIYSDSKRHFFEIIANRLVSR